MTIGKHGRTRLWALRDENGGLVAVFAYKKGAQAVAARLNQADANLHAMRHKLRDMQQKLHDTEQRLQTAQEQIGAACRCHRAEGALHPSAAQHGQKGSE